MPAEEEITQLAEFYFQSLNCSKEQKCLMVRFSAYIAVFEDYVSDDHPFDPSYQGRVMMVVWNNSPNDYEAYTWDEKNNLRFQSKLGWNGEEFEEPVTG